MSYLPLTVLYCIMLCYVFFPENSETHKFNDLRMLLWIHYTIKNQIQQQTITITTTTKLLKEKPLIWNCFSRKCFSHQFSSLLLFLLLFKLSELCVSHFLLGLLACCYCYCSWCCCAMNFSPLSNNKGVDNS